MSIYYYPYIFNAEGYLLKRENGQDSDELLTEFTDTDTEFPIDINKIAYHFRIDNQLQGSLPDVLASALEEEIVDIERENQQEKIQNMADIISKLGDKSALLNLEPYIGFITKEEVVKLISFFEDFTFQDDLIEELKDNMLVLLHTAEEAGKGLIYIAS